MSACAPEACSVAAVFFSCGGAERRRPMRAAGCGRRISEGYYATFVRDPTATGIEAVTFLTRRLKRTKRERGR